MGNGSLTIPFYVGAKFNSHDTQFMIDQRREYWIDLYDGSRKIHYEYVFIDNHGVKRVITQQELVDKIDDNCITFDFMKVDLLNCESIERDRKVKFYVVTFKGEKMMRVVYVSSSIKMIMMCKDYDKKVSDIVEVIELEDKSLIKEYFK